MLPSRSSRLALKTPLFPSGFLSPLGRLRLVLVLCAQRGAPRPLGWVSSLLDRSGLISPIDTGTQASVSQQDNPLGFLQSI